MKENVEDLVKKLHPLEITVLPFISKCKSLGEIAEKSGLQEVEAMRALQWMENKGILKIDAEVKETVQLDKNGVKYLDAGLPEKRFLKSLKGKELSIEGVKDAAKLDSEELNVCIGALRGKAAIQPTPNKKFLLTDNGIKLADSEWLEEKLLKKLSNGPVEIKSLLPEEKFAYEVLRKRKEIVKNALVKIKNVKITEIGKELAQKKVKVGDMVDRLTPDMIKEGSWKKKICREYDVRINVPKIHGGKRHFVNQAVEYIKQIWLDLGFKEMTGPLLQTSFRDLDALFVPQDHPARAMQDTFYIKDPKFGSIPKELLKRIKGVHENGADTGSKGWQTPWREDIARENLLRTHTTVLSAITLSRLKVEQLPAKFFAVGSVFRNEAISWKHLFEFNQVEGIVVDPNANFKHLKGYLREFFTKMGYKGVRIRPAHFPYTEPSAEIDVMHPVKKQWVELGGAGVFRPEVVKPLLGVEVPVLAWGFGLERIISEYYNITDIRDLYKNDLKQVRGMKAWIRK